MLITVKRMLSILIMTLVLSLGLGCSLDDGSDNNDSGNDGSDKNNENVFTFVLDEISEEIFYDSSLTMTMNEWFFQISEPNSISYDAWSAREKIYMYKDEKLETPFTGSDMVNENTVIYTEFHYNDYGKKTGEISGTITLTDISNPVPKVWIRNYKFTENSPPWWWLNAKIDMGEVNGASATLNWSIPVYEKIYDNWGFVPGKQSNFELLVLPAGGKLGYEVSVPGIKTINDPNENIGSLGTVSIKGVSVSGTINVTVNGEPVPYIEISIMDEGNALLNIAYLSPTGPETSWSVQIASFTATKKLKFNILGYNKSNPVPGMSGVEIWIDELYEPSPALQISNAGASGIMIDLGDQNW